MIKDLVMALMCTSFVCHSSMRGTLSEQDYNAFKTVPICDSLLLETNRPATEATPITSSTTTPSVTTPQNPMTSKGTVPVIRLSTGAGISLHSVSILVLLLAVLSCLSLL